MADDLVSAGPLAEWVPPTWLVVLFLVWTVGWAVAFLGWIAAETVASAKRKAGRKSDAGEVAAGLVLIAAIWPLTPVLLPLWAVWKLVHNGLTRHYQQAMSSSVQRP